MSSTQISLLHRNIVLCSEKQKSAQGSVYFGKMSGEYHSEIVLKVYNGQDLRSFMKEITFFKDFILAKTTAYNQGTGRQLIGFPRLISSMQGLN